MKRYFYGCVSHGGGLPSWRVSTHGMRNEKHLSSKLARDLSSLHSWFLDERELLHRHQQASDVTKMTCEAAPHSTACLLKSRCATRGKCGGCWKSPSPYPSGLLNCGWSGRRFDAGSDCGLVKAIIDAVRTGDALVHALMRLHNYGCSIRGFAMLFLSLMWLLDLDQAIHVSARRDVPLTFAALRSS